MTTSVIIKSRFLKSVLFFGILISEFLVGNFTLSPTTAMAETPSVKHLGRVARTYSEEYPDNNRRGRSAYENGRAAGRTAAKLFLALFFLVLAVYSITRGSSGPPAYATSSVGSPHRQRREFSIGKFIAGIFFFFTGSAISLLIVGVYFLVPPVIRFLRLKYNTSLFSD